MGAAIFLRLCAFCLSESVSDVRVLVGLIDRTE
ncbi:hypothetical protein IMSAG185_01351 [Lachnospiraceae bacterium]|nr:hypothetical protein IMSAG185_01351 [Lachnospiraceae bacterium]